MTLLYSHIRDQISQQITAFQERYGSNYTINARGVILKSDTVKTVKSDTVKTDTNKTDTNNDCSIPNIIHALFIIPMIKHCQKGQYPKSSYCIQHAVNDHDKSKYHHITHGELILTMMILGYDYEYSVDHQTLEFKCNCAGVFDSNMIPNTYEQMMYKYKELILRDHIDKDSMTVVQSFLC